MAKILVTDDAAFMRMMLKDILTTSHLVKAAAMTALLAVMGFGAVIPKIDEAVISGPVMAKTAEKSDSNSYSIKGVMYSAKSYDEVYEVIEKAKKEAEKLNRLYTDEAAPETNTASVATTESAAAKTASAAGGASDYSDTNVRTSDVDEGDLVKTDGKYIYQYYNNDLVRIVSIDKGKMKKISTIDLSGDEETYLDDMYVRDDRLILIADTYDTSLSPSAKNTYRINNNHKVCAYTYDITDRSKPKRLGKVTIDGSFRSSRLKDGYLYLMTSYGEPVYYLYDYLMPTTGVSINAATKTAAQKTDVESLIPKVNGKTIAAEDILIPETPKNEPFYTITAVKLDKPKVAVDTKSVMGYVDEVYASTDSIFFYSTDYSGNHERTEIVKFSYNKGKITPKAAGSVKGYVDDSFCIDEDEKGNLRVATTLWSGSKQESSLYILNKNLKKIGSLRNIAGNEGIKSCRFMGDIGYIVTFRNTDPLFTVDLSNPKKPKILSKLTIPGFSEYLHYWGDGLLLGIGYDADEKTGGTKGVKLSMFDVKNPKKTKEIAKLVLNVDTAQVLYGNYKSILIDPKKNLLGFSAGKWGNESDDWQGKDYYMLYSYKNKSFKKIKVFKPSEKYGYIDNVRGVYSGNYFYLVNDSKIKSYNLKSGKAVDTL